MAAKLFDRTDIADWELSVSITLDALKYPVIATSLPSFAARIEVLDLIPFL